MILKYPGLGQIGEEFMWDPFPKEHACACRQLSLLLVIFFFSALEDSDGSQDSPAGELPKRVHQPTGKFLKAVFLELWWTLPPWLPPRQKL